MPFAVALEGLHPNPATEVDAMVPLHLRGDLADDAAECADEWCGGTLHDRHREAQLAADRGYLGTDKARADDEDPARLGGQGLLQAGGVIAGADRKHPFEGGLFFVEPFSCASAGGD